METVFASAFLALLALSFASAKGRHCMFRVHAEASPNNTATFTTSVDAQLSGKDVAIEKVTCLSERDVAAFYPYSAADGSHGTLFET